MSILDEAKKPAGNQRSQLQFLIALFRKVRATAGVDAAKATIQAIGPDLVKAGQVSEDIYELFCEANDIVEEDEPKKKPAKKPAPKTPAPRHTPAGDGCSTPFSGSSMGLPSCR